MGLFEPLRTKLSGWVQTGACLAFSGGVDSSLILAIASGEAHRNHGRIQAVTFSTQLHPRSDIITAQRICTELDVPFQLIEVNEFEDPEIYNNPPDRCYRCKKQLFIKLKAYAQANGLPIVMDGTNADDLKEYRPGLKALSELGIHSPLAELGITKSNIREMASQLNLSVASRPSTPCLATRLPYGAKLEPSILKRIAKGEEILQKAGFKQVRIRLHGNIARIEVATDELPHLLEKSATLVPALKKLGFLYVTADLEGFCSGSMDLEIKP